MAVSLLFNEISDLCIGKPAVSSLPLSATIADAIAALDRSSSQSLLVVSDRPSTEKKRVVAGRVCLADVLCFLCSEENFRDPSGALGIPISVLFRKGCVRRVEPHSNLLEALGAIVDGGAEELVVPLRFPGSRKKQSSEAFLCLTQEDLVRHFLSSISSFSYIAPLSVSSLGLIQPKFPSIQPNCSATSALSLLFRHKTRPIALTTESGQLIGEISSAVVSSLESNVLSDTENLSVYDISSYIDCICRPESSLVAVMVQALAHRVDHVWVVDGRKDECKVVGIVTFVDVLSLFRDQMLDLEEIVEL